MRVAATSVSVDAEIAPRAEAPAEPLAGGTAFAPTLEQTIRAALPRTGESGETDDADASADGDSEEQRGRASDAATDSVAVLCAASSFLAALGGDDVDPTDLGPGADGEDADVLLGLEDAGSPGTPRATGNGAANGSSIVGTGASGEATSEASGVTPDLGASGDPAAVGSNASEPGATAGSTGEGQGRIQLPSGSAVPTTGPGGARVGNGPTAPLQEAGTAAAATDGANAGAASSDPDAATKQGRMIGEEARAARDSDAAVHGASGDEGPAARARDDGSEPSPGKQVLTREASGSSGPARASIGGGLAGTREDVPASAAGPSTALADSMEEAGIAASAAGETSHVRPDRTTLLRRSRRNANERSEPGAGDATSAARRTARSATGAPAREQLVSSDDFSTDAPSRDDALPPLSESARATLAKLEIPATAEKIAAPDGSTPTTASQAPAEARAPVSASIVPGSRTGLPSWAERIGELAKLEHLPARAEMRIELEPEGLGRLDVRLRIVGGELHASILADHEQTRGLLVRQQHLLESALHKSDVRLFQLDVDVRGDTQRRAPDLAPQSDGWTAPFAGSSASEDRREPLLAAPARTGRLSVRA